MSAYILTRDVTPAECHWLAKTVPAGSVVYRCAKPTYGAVRDFPATFDPDGDYPFFELPHDAVEWSCDAYPPPLTCDTAPSSPYCTPCADAADDAEFERLHKREQEAGAGL